MSAGKKTVLRSIRISEDHDRLLEEEAKKKGISVNSLLAILITKYLEWDRFSEKFGYVSIARQGYKNLVESLSDDAIITHSKEVGSHSAPDITRFWFGKLNVQTLFAFLELYSKYTGLFHFERTSHGKSHLITFHHELGPRVNLALMTYIDQVVRNIAGVAPKSEAGNNSFNVSFEEPIP